MPLDESGWLAPFSRWDVAVQTHPSSISQAACYNAAMVYVPVAMLPGAEVDDDSMFVEPFHRGAWLCLGWPRAPECRDCRLCRWTAMPCLRLDTPMSP